MKKLYRSPAAKAAAVLVCLVSGILSAAGLLMLVSLTLRGFPREGIHTKEMLLQRAYALAGDTYAADILTFYADDPDETDAHPERMSGFNWEYAVIGSSSGELDALDLEDESIYLYKTEGYTGYDYSFKGGRHWVFRYNEVNIFRAWYDGVYAFNMGTEDDGWYETVKDRKLIPLKYFWVLYQVKDPLVENGDLFVQARDMTELFWKVLQALVPVVVVSLVFLLLSLWFLFGAAGCRKNREEIVIRRTDRVPFLILAGVILCVELIGLKAGVILARNIGNFHNGFIAFWMIADAVAMGLLLILCWMSIAVRVKTGTFRETTVLYSVIKGIRNITRAASENLPLLWKCGAFLALLTILELYVIARTKYNSDVELAAFWLYKLIAVPVVLWIILQFDRICRRTKGMAEGDLSTPIETKGMFWTFKNHAEDINRIQKGMNTAVEERMKSERLKTELITNVSHDIKTPLTSIINYTDLLSKEEPESPAAREYVKVLSRQAERLKKLLEDLIEASKASTGSLTLQKEECDVSVILAQATAEFEDKLKKADLQLMVSQPETRTLILADGRYLWRIFENLLSNICKYALEGTRVYLDVKKEHGNVSVTCKNISREPLNISGDELLERFVRGDGSRNTEGSGLGLSIADSLARLMGGSMHLEIDGDLFKVQLAFPEYTAAAIEEKKESGVNEM